MCVKPVVHTQSCEAAHLQYHIAGRLRVVMDDGAAQDFGPGDVSWIPPGHDAWWLATTRWSGFRHEGYASIDSGVPNCLPQDSFLRTLAFRRLLPCPAAR